MKKQIKSQIKSLAARILEIEIDTDVTALKGLANDLYEKLVVLQYLEKQIEGESKTPQQESLDSKSFREENWFKEPEPLPKSQHTEDIVEPLMEKIKDLVAQMPSESQEIDSLLEDILPPQEPQKAEFEIAASTYQEMPVFERKEEPVAEPVIQTKAPVETEIETKKEEDVPKQKSLNDKLTQGLQLGLNDRIAFIKHLFQGETADFSRVVSQLSTFKSYPEAKLFIETSIKPEYNNWTDKEEFEARFLALIEKSFN